MSDECTHMVTDNRIGPNFGRPLIHRECSKQLAAAESARAALEEENKALREGLAPVMSYLTALVECADAQGHIREGDARSNLLAAVNDVWLRRSDIEQARALLAPAAEPVAADGGAGE